MYSPINKAKKQKQLESPQKIIISKNINNTYGNNNDEKTPKFL